MLFHDCDRRRVLTAWNARTCDMQTRDVFQSPSCLTAWCGMYNIADIVARHGRMKYTVGHKVKNINLTSQLFLLLLTLRERGRSHRETLGARVPPEFYSFSQNSVNNDLKHFILTRKNLKFLWRRDTVFSPDLFPDGKEHPSPHLTHKCSLHRDPLTLLSENAAFNLVME